MLTGKCTAARHQECTEWQGEASESWVSSRCGGDTENTKGQTSCASKYTSL
jgi:hypothetical protein